MSRNGSGTYSLPVNSWNPAQNSVPATAADWQSLINDVASALTQSVSRDGQTTMTGSLPMGGNKLTGLAAGTASGDSLRWEQLFSQGQPQDLASAATTDIGAQLTTVLNITGTTTITSFGTNYNGPRFLRFDGILTLTHGAALVLPGGANITTAEGDSAIVVPLGNPATGWRVVVYERASGAAFDGSVTTNSIQDDAVTFAKMQNIPTGTILGRSTAGTGDVEALTGAQAAEIAGGNPAGAVIYVAMNSAPTGYLRANGATVSRATFAALFAAIGTTYGAGDGSTTFNLPDLRGEFIRGWDDGRGVDSGRVLGSAQAHQMQSHSHRLRGTGHDTGGTSLSVLGLTTSFADRTNEIEATGGTSNGSENRPRNVAMLACIKF